MRKRSEVFLLFVILLILSFSLIFAGTYGTGSFGEGSFNIGEVPVSGTVTPSGGGGGGCTYNWVCTNWFPTECPVEGIQERICANKGTCSGTSGIPEQTRTCVYEHKEPLFDVFLTIFQKDEKLCAGDKIRANVKLENYGKQELLDAFMTYWIIDKNNTLITELKDTRNVASKLDFDISLNIPDSTSPGIYRLYAEMTYSGNKTAVAGGTFEIAEKDYCEIPSRLLRYLPLILIGTGFLIMFILIIILYRKFHHHFRTRKEIKVVRRIKRKKHEKSKIMEFFRKLRRKIKKRRIERRELKQKEERLSYQRRMRMYLFKENQRKLQKQKIARIKYLGEEKIRLERQRIARRKSEEERKKGYNQIIQEREREKQRKKNRLKWKRFLQSFKQKIKSSKKIRNKKVRELINKKKKPKKFIHLTLVRGSHEENVKLEE